MVTWSCMAGLNYTGEFFAFELAHRLAAKKNVQDFRDAESLFVWVPLPWGDHCGDAWGAGTKLMPNLLRNFAAVVLAPGSLLDVAGGRAALWSSGCEGQVRYYDADYSDYHV